MIIHLIPKSTFSLGEIQFLDEVFGKEKLDHWLYGQAWHGYNGVCCSSNIHEVSGILGLLRNPTFRKRLGSCSFILIDNLNVSLLYTLFPHLKCSIVQFWGGDLYSIINPRGLIGRFRSRLAMIVLKRCAGYLTLTESEYLKLSRKAHLNGFHHVGAVGATMEELEATYTRANHRGKQTRVLIGNSATLSGRHKEAIDLIAKYASYGVQVYLPLSYGNVNYAQKVANYGYEVFGGHFHPLMEYMPKSEYSQFLSTIDVAVFNNERQQGLGNLYQLLLSGAKVYLPENSDLYTHFFQLGFKVFPIGSISSANYYDFRYLDEDDRAHNSYLADPEEIWRRWVNNWSIVKKYILNYD